MAGGPAPVVATPPPAPYGAPPMGMGMGMGGMGAPMPGPAPDMGYGGGGFGGPPPGAASRAVLTGGAGIFTVQVGMEMRAGRDGAVCQLLLNEPRVSGTHATLKVEGGQLLVRDENSNNGDLGMGGYTGGGGGGGLYGGGGGGSGSDGIDDSIDAPLGFGWRVVGGGGGGGSSLGATTEAGAHEGDGQVTVTPIAGSCDTATPVTNQPTTVAPANVAKAVDAKPTYTG